MFDIFQGEKVKSELLDMVRELPTNVYQPVTEKIRELSDVLTYYQEFIKFSSGK